MQVKLTKENKNICTVEPAYKTQCAPWNQL